MELLARICNLRLNPDVARPLARFMSRLSRPYDKTFQTQTLGANLQFGSKPGCGATLGTTFVQIFQTLCPDFPDSNSWRETAFLVVIRRRRDPWHYSCPDFPDLMTILFRLKLLSRISIFGSKSGSGASLGAIHSRLYRPYDKTFKVQTLATMHFGSKRRCGATPGATHVQNFQTLSQDFPDSNSRRECAFWV